MPRTGTDDDVELYSEEEGSGVALVFVHEFAWDRQSWEPRLRDCARRRRRIAFNERGFPPSDAPSDTARCSQRRARDAVRAVLDGLDIESAHVVGLSTAGLATLHFGLNQPDHARSLVVAGVGYEPELDERARRRDEADPIAVAFSTDGMAAVGGRDALGPARVEFANSDRLGRQEFAHQRAGHSTEGAARTPQGVEEERPLAVNVEVEPERSMTPVLLRIGDEDGPCRVPSVLLDGTVPLARSSVIPGTERTAHLEEPAASNAALETLHAHVNAGRFRPRDPHAVSESLTGMR